MRNTYIRCSSSVSNSSKHLAAHRQSGISFSHFVGVVNFIKRVRIKLQSLLVDRWKRLGSQNWLAFLLGKEVSIHREAIPGHGVEASQSLRTLALQLLDLYGDESEFE